MDKNTKHVIIIVAIFVITLILLAAWIEYEKEVTNREAIKAGKSVISR